MVISTSCSRASRSTRSVSSGLAKRASATVVVKPMRGEHLGRLQAFLQPRAVRQQRDRGAFPHDSAFADLERHADFRHVDADTVAARIAQRRRAIVDRDRGRDHVHELGLVGRRHQHEAGQAAEIGDVERARMGRTVGADQPGAIEREAHRQPLDRDVVHDLVVGALQEGRVDRRERLVAFGRKAGREGDACCSAMPTSKVRCGNALPKMSMPVPPGIAAVIATILSSFCASFTRLSPNTLV